MKILVSGNLNINEKVLLNRLGYHLHRDRHSNQISYIKRLGGQQYPRWHIYVNNNGSEIIFNLHLDEKKPSYEGSPRHSGQYSGEVVANEANRINDFLKVN
ncbi:hypothetical protein IID19_05420 [Patescibacteria group bacterium]|nr:hypothetical protein [Patescibacteria group bacterium]